MILLAGIYYPEGYTSPKLLFRSLTVYPETYSAANLLSMKKLLTVSSSDVVAKILLRKRFTNTYSRFQSDLDMSLIEDTGWFTWPYLLQTLAQFF